MTEGCFKYVTHEIGSDREHITWFSFEGEYVGDYPSCLDGRPAQTSIEAMMSSRVLRVTGGQLMQLFRQNMETMELRSIIAEHLLSQAHRSYLELHRATARERYELLLRRCPEIVDHLSLNAISSFLRPDGSGKAERLSITPQMLSKIRKGITFDAQQ